jgi:hypothetical protein
MLVLIVSCCVYVKAYIYYIYYIMIHNVQSNTAKFFVVNINQKCNMFRRFLDRHHQAF